jgi:uncharacterized membrane protein
MKMMRMIFGLCLLLVSLLLISPTVAVLAQEETPPPEKLTMTATYSKLEGIAGTSFEFEVGLKYEGAEARVFDLSVSGPQDWTTFISPTYPEDKQILDIRLEPVLPYQTTAVPTKILVHVSPPYWLLPEPGEYPITVEASSGEVTGTINLTAVVTSTYRMSLTTPEGRLNTTATAGKDNYFSITVENNGSAAIDNITLSSDKPSGWTIDFNPKEIDSVGAQSSQTIEVNIKPPAKTIAGDYEITLNAEGKQISDDIDIRVTVETPTIWGWVGVGIIIVVVAGVAFVFMRFSRR